MRWSPYDYARKTTPSCTPGWPLREAAGLFAEEDVGSILVRDEAGGYAGILTSKVVLRAIAADEDISGINVGDMKLEPAVFVSKDAGMDEVREMFKKSPCGRLLMTDDNGNVVGVLKRRNIERFSIFHHVKQNVHRHIRGAKSSIHNRVKKMLTK